MKTIRRRKHSNEARPARVQPKTNTLGKKVKWLDSIEQEVGKEMAESTAQFDQLYGSIKEGSDAFKQIRIDVRARLLFLGVMADSSVAFKAALEERIPNIKRQATETLCTLSHKLNTLLIYLAQAGEATAAACIWDNGMEMVKAIDNLADK